MTSNGIGTTEIAPPPQSGGGGTSQPPPPNHPQATSVIGGSVSTFKGGHQPQAPHSTNLSNGSPIMRGNHNHMNNNNNNETLQHSLGHLSEHPQQQQQHLQQVTSSPLSSFKMNYFQKNRASSLFVIANRNGAGGATGGNGVPVDNTTTTTLTPVLIPTKVPRAWIMVIVVGQLLAWDEPRSGQTETRATTGNAVSRVVLLPAKEPQQSERQWSPISSWPSSTAVGVLSEHE